MIKYLQLIRWPYLAFIVVLQFTIKYVFIEPLFKVLFPDGPIPIMMNTFGMSLLSLATVLLAGAGFIIHTLYDLNPQGVDLGTRSVKSGKIKVKTAFNLFFGFNILAMLIGLYLSNMVGYPSFAILFILASGLLYACAKSLKKYFIIRSVIWSILGALAVIAVILFDLFPAMDATNGETLMTFMNILKDYALFFAVLVFIREQIVNQKNSDRDYRNGWNTLSVSLGRQRTNKLIFLFNLLPIAAVVYYLYKYLYLQSLSLGYGVLFILAPLVVVSIKILNAEKQKDYHNLQILMSLIMVFGFLSLGLFSYIL